jgi:hypothetical protein
MLPDKLAQRLPRLDIQGMEVRAEDSLLKRNVDPLLLAQRLPTVFIGGLLERSPIIRDSSDSPAEYHYVTRYVVWCDIAQKTRLRAPVRLAFIENIKAIGPRQPVLDRSTSPLQGFAQHTRWAAPIEQEPFAFKATYAVILLNVRNELGLTVGEQKYVRELIRKIFTQPHADAGSCRSDLPYTLQAGDE